MRLKNRLLFYAIFITSSLFAQKVVPFVDFNDYFRTFENDNFRQLEFQPIRSYQAGDDLVAYIDTRGNLRVYDGNERQDISNMIVSYKISDHLLAYNIGPTLNMWDAGKLQTLTYFTGDYEVTDSLIVFQDTRFNTVNVYWNKQVIQLYQTTGDNYMPVAIGDNIVAFKDNGNFYKVFWRGEIYELGVWHNPIAFKAGCDVLCFNDPTTQTFAVFENGEFLDVEQFHMGKHKAGRGFIVYEDLNGNLNYYSNGTRAQLSNFSAKFWDAKDDLVVWTENNFMFALQDGRRIEVTNYLPKDHLIKNNTLVFRSLIGGVSVLSEGKVHELTNQMDAEYEIFGNTVLLKLFNRSFIVFKKGKKYTA
jgi:hypothetical protein